MFSMVRRQFKLGPARRFSNHPCRFAFADRAGTRLLLLGSAGGMMFYELNWKKC
ncbi:MAG: hypothetical protein MK364_03815 [Pirellulales bacterium]|nr:hypothetical protein [Pirellulales bacterium]